MERARHFGGAADESESSRTLWLQRTITLSVWAAAAIAVMGLLEYVSGSHILGRIQPGYILVDPATAVCFLILCLALSGFVRTSWRGAGLFAIAGLVILVTAFGLLDVVGGLAGAQLSFEATMFAAAGALGGIPVGRMSPGTAIAFSLAGLATLLLLLRSRPARHARRLGNWATGLGVLTLLLGTTVLLSYLYGTPFETPSNVVPMTASTSVAFILLGIALSSTAGPDSFVVRRLTRDSTASRLTRVFVPLTVMVILLQSVLARLLSNYSTGHDALLVAVLAALGAAVTAAAVDRAAQLAGGALDRANRELREAYDDLRKSRDRSRTIIESALDGFWLVDTQGRLLEVNEAYCQMSGYRADELLGMNISDLDVVEADADTAAHIQRILTKGHDRFQSRHRRKDGTHFDIDASVRYSAVEGGRIAGFVRDITEPKRAAEELRESEYFFRESQRAAAIGSYKTDFIRGIWTSSEVLDQIFGIDRDYRRTVQGWLEIVHPDDVEMMDRYLREEVIGRRRPFDKAYRIVRKSDGQTRWVVGRGVVEFDERGTLVSMTGTIHDITKSKWTEEENQTILRTTIDGYYLVDQNGRFLDTNDSYCQMIGYSRDELLSMAVKDIEAIDTDNVILERIQQILTLGSLRFDTKHRRKDGSVIDVEASVTALRDSQGKLVCFMRDVTDRKLAEEAVRTSEEEFRLLAEAMPQIVWATRKDGWNTYFNQQWVEYTGRSLQESFGHGWNIPFHPDDRQRAWDAWQRATTTGGNYSLECRLRRADGEYRWWLIRGVPVLDKTGEILKWFGTCTDIDDMKRTETALQENERALIEAQQVSRIGSWRYDVTKDEATWSRQMFDLFGRDPGLGEPSWQEHRSSIHPDDWAAVDAAVVASSTAGTPYSIEFRLLHPTHGLRWAWTVGTAERNAAGAVVQLKGTVQDITDRKRAEEEKGQLEAQLQQAQKMESVGRLAGGVAHDFNNMLGVIIGHAELGLGGVDVGHPLRANLVEIRTAAQRSADLTRQLLAFARQQTVTPRVLDLNTVVAGALKMLERLIGEEIKLRWRPAKDVWPVTIDPTQVDQILANLCVNARDAIDGVRTIVVSTGNCAFDDADCASLPGLVPGEYVRLEVVDDGCGMDAETKTHMFEPFFTTKAVGEGTGLGLASVYGAVKQNAGTVDVRSELGAGTTITIYLPRTVAKTAALETEATAGAIERGHETILLVEDEPTLLKLASFILERQGYRVLAAATPAAAIRLATEQPGPIHLLMTDVVMPEMNGRALAKQILALQPCLKCLFMSGYTADVVASHGIVDEAVSFLQKPFTIDTVAAKVRETLDRA